MYAIESTAVRTCTVCEQNDSEVRLVPPGRPVDYGNSYPLTDDSSWLARRIDAGDVERVGPVPETSTDERQSPTNLPPRRD